MASLRTEQWIGRPADEVWAHVSDAAAISNWFPGIVNASVEGDVRTIELDGGVELVEDIVTNDSGLRRFQYSITGGPMPIERHLGTVDVIDNRDGCLVIYSTEIVPDETAGMMGPAIEAGCAGLKAHCEAS